MSSCPNPGQGRRCGRIAHGFVSNTCAETVAGAGELLHRSTLDAATLRKNVTSPAGTTAAALDVLMSDDGGLDPLMRKRSAAAAKRSRELAG